MWRKAKFQIQTLFYEVEYLQEQIDISDTSQLLVDSLRDPTL